ncbi:MAG: ABC transporter permease [Candidatus Zixiibacteriota bacterium]|nr:MAG: ABC transporter permease [candidate division Zixibacteria bacterium]
MLKNYITVALRSLARHKIYSLINIFGLAVGLALCLIVIGHISYELSFENFHENKDRIYRINLKYMSEDTELYSSLVMSPLGPALRESLPEAEKVAVFRVIGNIDLSIGEDSFRERYEAAREGFKYDANVFCAGPEYLEIFTLPLVDGDPKSALVEPFTMLITETAARKYFKGINPIGQIVKINDKITCRITGVLKEIPPNTQLNCEFIVSYSSLQHIDENLASWEKYDQDYVYMLLNEDVDLEEVEAKISAIFESRVGKELASRHEFELQPLKDIYFSYYGSGRMGDISPHGEISMMIEMGVIAGFVLLLAIANFINLSTARSSDRNREVGVRKVFGAHKIDLIKQFIGESIIITFIAVLIGLLAYEIFKIIVQDALPRQMLADFYNNNTMILLIAALTIAVGVIAGYYPALYLSRFRPIAVLQGKSGIKSSRSLLRRGLVVFQFTIAIGFICSTTIIYRQINFITNMELGFNSENMLVINLNGKQAAENAAILKNEIQNKNKVLSITAANAPPGAQAYSPYIYYKDQSFEDSSKVVFKKFSVDNNFVSTFGLEVIRGQTFSEYGSADGRNAVMVTEAVVRNLKITEPIGHKLYRQDGLVEIIGVLKDFHGTPLNYSYKPNIILKPEPEELTTLAVKLPPEDISASVAAIKDTWDSTFPGKTFNYAFLDDLIEGNYSDDRGSVKMFTVLSALAILIACLGIFGLVSFTAEKKTKEIGIRKVLGASVPNIVKMLSREFVILIAISSIIAWPLAYLLMQSFLQWFPFRVSIGVGTFLFTGFMALALAMITSGFQAVRAAAANPVDALRCE